MLNLVAATVRSRADRDRRRGIAADTTRNLTVAALHELGRADLLVGLDARQRVPTGIMAPMRDLGIEEVTPESAFFVGDGQGACL